MEAFLDQRNCEVSDIYSDPWATELFRCVNCCPTATERVKNDVILIAGSTNNSNQLVNERSSALFQADKHFTFCCEVFVHLSDPVV